jgi:uncharacterized lipoprotein YajG
MKRLTIRAGKYLLLLACLAALGGCASQQLYVVDSEKVAKIERAAAVNGVQIHWVRYPQKAVVH